MPIPKSVIYYLGLAKRWLYSLFDAFNNDELFVIDRTDVIRSYLDFKIDDIEEFAAAYTYERHDVMNSLDDRESKELMFKEVYEILLPLKEKGLLNR